MPKNINDVVSASHNPVYGKDVVRAYVSAFQLGFRILAGIAIFQLLLCLLLSRVVLEDMTQQNAVELVEEVAYIGGGTVQDDTAGGIGDTTKGI